MKRIFSAAAIAVVLTGCAGMQTIEQERQGVSSGFTGCAPQEISISDQAQYTWAAVCKGKTYRCTVSPSAACAPAP